VGLESPRAGEVEHAPDLAWVAPVLGCGLVDDAVAVRQFAGHVGHPQPAADLAVGLAPGQVPHAGPAAGTQIEMSWAGRGPR